MTPTTNGGAQSEGGSSGSSGGRVGVGSGPEGGPVVLKKGPWTAAEDQILMDYVKKHGEGNWNSVQKYSGLNRCGKSCRLRWANHLRPNLKKGSFTPDEERLILELHAKYGNKWARMAAQLPGRTDNEIKNYWNTRVKRRKRQGLPLYPNDIQRLSHSQPTTPTSSLNHMNPPTTPTSLSFSFQSQTQSQIPFSPTPTPPPHSPMSSSPYPTLASPSSFEPNNSSPFSAFSSPSSSSPSFSFHRPVPLLGAPIRFKSFRDSTGFSIPTQQSSCALLGQYAPTQLTEPASFQFPLTFDPTLPQNVATQFDSEHLGPTRSVKSELPSSQFHQIQPEITSYNNNNNNNHNNNDTKVMSNSATAQRNGGLLEDLLENLMEEAQRSVESSSEMVPKEEAKDQINSLPEDLSKLLNFVPGTLQVPDWYSDSSEISHGQSLGVTDHNLSLDVQHLASFFPIASPADNSQTPASWDSLPGICKGWFKHT